MQKKKVCLFFTENGCQKSLFWKFHPKRAKKGYLLKKTSSVATASPFIKNRPPPRIFNFDKVFKKKNFVCFPSFFRPIKMVGDRFLQFFFIFFFFSKRTVNPLRNQKKGQNWKKWGFLKFNIHLKKFKSLYQKSACTQNFYFW